jgi:hypothetical protein
MDKIKKLPIKKLVELVKQFNYKTRMATVTVKADGNRVLLVISGPQARYMSNALYHLFRALGRRRVRRWTCGSDWCVAFS